MRNKMAKKIAKKKYVLLGGSHVEGGKEAKRFTAQLDPSKPETIVESERALDEIFKGKFKKYVAPKKKGK